MKKTNGAAAVLRRSWQMVSPYRGKIYLGAVCALLATGLSAISAYTLRVLVDDILPMKRAEPLWPIQFVFIGAVLCSSLMTVLQSFFFAQAGKRANGTCVPGCSGGCSGRTRWSGRKRRKR